MSRLPRVWFPLIAVVQLACGDGASPTTVPSGIPETRGALEASPITSGEVRSFALPNSAIRVSYSLRFFHLLENRDPSTLQPEIRVDVASQDFFSGRDPVLERIEAFVGR